MIYARRGSLLSIRDGVRVVDATIRDGGLYNNFKFNDKFVTNYTRQILNAA